MLLKLRVRMWIDKATDQWARVEAETTDTISWGLLTCGSSAVGHVAPGKRVPEADHGATSQNQQLWHHGPRR